MKKQLPCLGKLLPDQFQVKFNSLHQNSTYDFSCFSSGAGDYQEKQD